MNKIVINGKERRVIKKSEFIKYPEGVIKSSNMYLSFEMFKTLKFMSIERNKTFYELIYDILEDKLLDKD